MDFDDFGHAVSYLNGCFTADSDFNAPVKSKAFLVEPGIVFKDDLRNDAAGPSMVVVSAGSYRMGDLTGTYANEIPVRRVSLDQPFAISRGFRVVRDF